MYKLWICALILMMALTLASCNGTEGEDADNGKQGTGKTDIAADPGLADENAKRMLIPSVFEKDAFTAVGLSIEVDFDDTSAIQGIWDTFYKRMDEIHGYGPPLGISFPEHTTFIYFACQAIQHDDDIPSGMEKRDIPAATYAVFPFDGLPEEMWDFMMLIKSEYLPAAGLVPDRNNNISFEMYPPDAYDDVTGELRADIYIPILPVEDDA